MSDKQMDYIDGQAYLGMIESQTEDQVAEAVNKGLRAIAKDNNMNLKELAEALGYSYSHTLSIMNGSKTLKLDFLDGLASGLGMDVLDLSLKYFVFELELEGSKEPAIAIFNDDRVTELHNRFRYIVRGDQKTIQALTEDEIRNKAIEVLRVVYDDYMQRKAEEEYGQYELDEFIKRNRPQMVAIFENLVEEPDEFLEEINDYIEFRKTKKEQK